MWYMLERLYLVKIFERLRCLSNSLNAIATMMKSKLRNNASLQN